MSDANIKSILIIKDVEYKSHNNLANFLDKKIFSTYVISNIDEAESWFHLLKFDLAIICADLHYSASLTRISQIRKNHSDLAIILLTDLKNEKIAFNSISHGIDDYLIEGEYNIHEFIRTVRNTIERKKQFRKLQRDFAKFTDSISRNNFENLFVNMSSKIDAFDIGSIYALLKKNFYISDKSDILDNLTSLPNKSQFQETIQACIFKHKKNFAVFIVDIDKFNFINDLYGHTVGDFILISVSRWLQRKLGQEAFLARIGGDKFGIVVYTSNIKNCENLAKKLHSIAKNLFKHDDIWIRVTISIGIAINTYEESGRELAKNAQIALFGAQKNGGNSYQYFNDKVDESKKRLLSIEQQLHFAAVNNEFSLLFQPIVELQSRKVIGFEALLRWHSAVLGDIEPDIFIRIAETNSTISEITDWVIKKVVMYVYDWLKKANPSLFVSINLSSLDIMNPRFYKKMLANLKKMRVSPKNIYVELTETAIMDDEFVADKNLLALSKTGVKVLIDDFGTGYSSLNRIKSLPVDIIKIDKAFVRDVISDDVDCQVIKSIISLAQSLKLETLAEGIESEAIALYMQNLGCQYGQGFHFAKPMGINEAILFYEKNGKF